VGGVEGKNSIKEQLKNFGIKLLERPLELKKVAKLEKVEHVQVREEVTKK
jgi:hypothetical protein